MAHRTPAPLRALGSVLRALLGLALLTALTVGVPYLLLTVGHQPTELTGGWDLLTQQDDGSLFLVVLTCIGWAGGAAFTFSVLVELVAVLRRRSADRSGRGDTAGPGALAHGPAGTAWPMAARRRPGRPRPGR